MNSITYMLYIRFLFVKSVTHIHFVLPDTGIQPNNLKKTKNRGRSHSCRLPLLHFSCTPSKLRLLAHDLSRCRLHPHIPRPPLSRRHRPPPNPASPPLASEARFRWDRPSSQTAWAVLLRNLRGPSGAGLGIRAHGVAARPHPGESSA
jgi:hypothetical protein